MFGKKSPRPRQRNGFVLGQLVRHKVSGNRAVIVRFDRVVEKCTLSQGFASNDEWGGIWLHEIEAIKADEVKA